MIRRLMGRLYLLSFLIVSVCSFGQEALSYLKNWKAYPIPSNIEVYNHSEKDWVVYMDKQEVRVVDDRSEKFKFKEASKKLPFSIKKRGLSDVIEVSDGYLACFDRGEWGGGLSWYSKDGQESEELYSDFFSLPIKQFIQRENQIYALSGIAHLGISCGDILKIEKKENKWVVNNYLSLSGAAYAMQLDRNGNILVMTEAGLFSVDKQAKPDTLSLKQEGKRTPIIEVDLPTDTLRIKSKPVQIEAKWKWGFLYPTSMVVHNYIVYVGMRGGVYAFDLITYKEQWLLPD